MLVKKRRIIFLGTGWKGGGWSAKSCLVAEIAAELACVDSSHHSACDADLTHGSIGLCALFTGDSSQRVYARNFGVQFSACLYCRLATQSGCLHVKTCKCNLWPFLKITKPDVSGRIEHCVGNTLQQY